MVLATPHVGTRETRIAQLCDIVEHPWFRHDAFDGSFLVLALVSSTGMPEPNARKTAFLMWFWHRLALDVQSLARIHLNGSATYPTTTIDLARSC